MVVPLAARSLAAVAGGLLVLTAWASVIGTLIVSRSVGSWITRLVDRVVMVIFDLATRNIAEYERRDRVLAVQPATVLLTQLIIWLGTAFAGYALLLWPFAPRGVGSAFTASGSALFTLGFDEPAGGAPSAIVFAAAATGLVIVTLQIAYLPTFVRGVQPEGDRGRLAERAGRHPVLWPGTAGADALRTGIGSVVHRHSAGPLRPVGTLGRGRRGKPHHLPAARPVPLARRAVVLGDGDARRAGLRGAVPGALTKIRAGSTGAAMPAQRIPVLQPHRAGDGHRDTR